jgi:hypothetical protein
MGLFDKKLKKSFDQDASELLPPVAESPPQPVTEPTPPPAPQQAVPKPVKIDHPDYGINKAIELMRMLPDENIELIVRVVKTTLESTNINVANIVSDATRKQTGIENRIDVVRKEIAGFESEIATRRTEISTLEADHKETSMVKERFELAEKLAHEPQRPTTTSATQARPAPSESPRPASGTLPPTRPG